MIGVNGFEPAGTIKSYRKSLNITFPLVMNGKGKADITRPYRVSYYPTTYLLDSRGKIVARFEGFDEKTHQDLKATLAKMGLRPR